MLRRLIVFWVGLSAGVCGFAQNVVNPASPSPPSSPAVTGQSPVSRNWNHFASETFAPLTVAGGVFNASVSQATNSDPKYGVGTGAWGERIGASTANIAAQNFFGDFVMASAFHQNTIYERRGPGYGGVWKRAGYAISRAVVTKSDRGEDQFNWSNVTGTAMMAGFANLYYPPASRNGGATALNFGTSLAGSGFANLAPEFWPDFKATLQRHHLFPRR